ncbi:LuxR C-terminal-related transcriptional regulator [Microvirga yunnanensis]|uniref:LuxR C-terminal-related transcriptional regulator n=1 Tax=Microvirga yunnanensis TaxID=2953740 RepID=UPI0021C64DD7|nr:LuxR C-terminal-related transcriptional regulator [Microvirga sp. HBU65207]
MLAGKTNKSIGRDIGPSPRTVETHRAHVMQRLGAELVTSRAGRNLGGIPVAQPRAEGASGVRHARSLTVWQECPFQNAVLMRDRQSGRTALHARQSGMSLRDHPQHFPSAQSFMSHDP